MMQKFDEVNVSERQLRGFYAWLVTLVALSWCLFQLWIASPLPFIFGWGILIDVPKRAVHLCFALLLAYLLFGARNNVSNDRVPLLDLFLGFLAVGCTLYIPFFYRALVERQGILLDIP